MASKKLTVEQQQLFDVLTALQKKFALAIVKGKNQTDAYKSAKGKAKGDAMRAAASRIYANVNVVAFIKSVQSEAIDEAIMGREEALRRLTSLGRTSLFDLAEFRNSTTGMDEDGSPISQASWSFKDSALITPEAMAAIAELTAGPQGFKIKLHDPKVAIKQLAELQGWDAPKVVQNELTNPDGSLVQKPTVIRLVGVSPDGSSS